MAYLLKDDDGLCSCQKELSLLYDADHPDGYPAFLICFACRIVTQIKGDDGQTVVYRRGKRKKFLKTTKDPKANLGRKRERMIEHQEAKREGQHG